MSGLKKMYSVLTMEYYSAFKKKETLSFMTMWMSMEDIMPSETSQTQKEKYYVITLILRNQKQLNS